MDALIHHPTLIIGLIACYFGLLIAISYWTTSDDSSNDTFFTAGKSSSWWLVAIGMIGASLSGVTFISIPGVVGKEGINENFSYMQMVFGYLVGYLVIATVLMPIYYKYNLISIYGYLEKRLGRNSYKIGSAYFLLSRLIGASFRLFLVAIVLDKFVLGPMGIHFLVTVAITIGLIWLYTNRGGIKTIVVTDVFQTVAMLTAVVLTILGITEAMGYSAGQAVEIVQSSDYAKLFYFGGGWEDSNNFWKQFISGALIALVMTGLDQDMMQKNLTCRSLGDAQKNVFFFSIILVVANLLFLSMGALLYVYADFISLPPLEKSDYLYPTIALEHLSPAIGIAFLLGLIAAAYSSADSALTSLTTAFCVDFLEMDKRAASMTDKSTRLRVHIMMSLALYALIALFYWINDDSVVNSLFKIAGYTYGPLLGLFAFSILTKLSVQDVLVIPVCLLAPIITYVLVNNSENWFNGFQFGFLNLPLNGLLTFIGLLIISIPSQRNEKQPS